MKISSWSLCGPMLPLWKQDCILVSSLEANYSAPLIFLQRPKWIVSDSDWKIICESVTINLPRNFEVTDEN